jgi:hypothetical protein
VSKVLVYSVNFSLVNTLGKETSGPYSIAIGVDDGPPEIADQMTHSIVVVIASTIDNNRDSIFAFLNPAGASAPGGNVRINNYGLSGSPFLWRVPGL